MKTPLFVCAASLFLAFSVCAEGPFVDLKFDDALTQAAKENKIVLVDFYTSWCVPCKLLDKTTWRDADVTKLLGEKTVPLKIDAEKEKDLAAKYKIPCYPTVLLLKPNGTEIDRLCGYMEPKLFIANFTLSVNGKDSVMRAKEALEKAGDKDPMARVNLATVLQQKGDYAVALAEFLSCYDSAREASSGVARMPPSILLGDIAQLAKVYPPALQALETRRDAQEKAVFSDGQDRQSVIDLADLYEYLHQEEKSLALFDKLPVESRSFILREVIGQLVEAKRYRDILDCSDPEAVFAQRVALFKHEMSLSKDDPDLERIASDSTITAGSCYFEALAGTGKNDAALKLAREILQFNGDDKTRELLEECAKHAGNAVLAERLKTGKI